jgi:hypothetical protein
MMQWIRDLFDQKSTVSSLRVMSMMCIVSACGMGITAIYRNSNLSEAAVLCGVFLGAGFGGKVTQKITEVKSGKEN